MIIPNDMIVHIGKIFMGEYNIPVDGQNLKILDIGANIGGFAVWASLRWPGSTIHCYEPVPINFHILKTNVEEIMPRVDLNQVAVANSYGSREMYLGKNNCGEASFYKASEQSNTKIEVPTIDGSDLPKSHIIKIDTEGAEVEIVNSIVFNPKVYIIEYHSRVNLEKIHEMLHPKYNVLTNNDNTYNRGIVKYIDKSIAI